MNAIARLCVSCVGVGASLILIHTWHTWGWVFLLANLATTGMNVFLLRRAP